MAVGLRTSFPPPIQDIGEFPGTVYSIKLLSPRIKKKWPDWEEFANKRGRGFLLDFAHCYGLLLSFIRRKRDKSLLDRQAAAKGFKDFEWMRKDPNLESIRGDPRYNASQSRS